MHCVSNVLQILLNLSDDVKDDDADYEQEVSGSGLGTVDDGDTFVDDEDFRGSQVTSLSFRCAYLNTKVRGSYCSGCTMKKQKHRTFSVVNLYIVTKCVQKDKYRNGIVGN